MKNRQIDCGHERPGDWRPPRRSPGLPDAGEVMLEEQPDEEHAFGPAALLVSEWRETKERKGNGSVGSRVDGPWQRYAD